MRGIAPGVMVMALGAASIGCGGTHAVPTARAGAPQARAAQRATDVALYWAGPSFSGMRLTSVLRGAPTTFVYGTCTPSSDGGCAPPLQIQVSSTCDRNPLLLDIRPHARFRARGATVFDYGEGTFELSAGTSHVVVWARPALARRAIAALRSIEGPSGAGPLPHARYPRTYSDELARVQHAYARTPDLRAVRDALHISKSQVAFELALADDLGRQGRHRTARCPIQHR